MWTSRSRCAANRVPYGNGERPAIPIALTDSESRHGPRSSTSTSTFRPASASLLAQMLGTQAAPGNHHVIAHVRSVGHAGILLATRIGSLRRECLVVDVAGFVVPGSQGAAVDGEQRD